jgi:hypothetical protein
MCCCVVLPAASEVAATLMHFTCVAQQRSHFYTIRVFRSLVPFLLNTVGCCCCISTLKHDATNSPTVPATHARACYARRAQTRLGAGRWASMAPNAHGLAWRATPEVSTRLRPNPLSPCSIRACATKSMHPRVDACVRVSASAAR